MADVIKTFESLRKIALDLFAYDRLRKTFSEDDAIRLVSRAKKLYTQADASLENCCDTLVRLHEGAGFSVDELANVIETKKTE